MIINIFHLKNECMRSPLPNIMHFRLHLQNEGIRSHCQNQAICYNIGIIDMGNLYREESDIFILMQDLLNIKKDKGRKTWDFFLRLLYYFLSTFFQLNIFPFSFVINEFRNMASIKTVEYRSH